MGDATDGAGPRVNRARLDRPHSRRQAHVRGVGEYRPFRHLPRRVKSLPRRSPPQEARDGYEFKTGINRQNSALTAPSDIELDYARRTAHADIFSDGAIPPRKHRGGGEKGLISVLWRIGGCSCHSSGARRASLALPGSLLGPVISLVLRVNLRGVSSYSGMLCIYGSCPASEMRRNNSHQLSDHKSV